MMRTCFNYSPVTNIGIVSRMACSITDCLWKHGVNPSPKSEIMWSKVEEWLNLTRKKLKSGKENGIICKMFGTCLEAASPHKECKVNEMNMLGDEVEQRKRREILLSLQIEQLQKLLREKKEKTKHRGQARNDNLGAPTFRPQILQKSIS